MFLLRRERFAVDKKVFRAKQSNSLRAINLDRIRIADSVETALQGTSHTFEKLADVPPGAKAAYKLLWQ